MKITVVGDWFNDTGYASHTKGIVNALIDNGVEICMMCNRPENWIAYVNDREYKMLTNTPNNSDYQLLITLPSIAPLYLNDDIPAIQYCVWEGDKIPRAWVDILEDNRIKHIVAPSTHTKDAILKTCEECGSEIYEKIKAKLHIVSHGVDSTKFYPKKNEM